MKNITIIGLTLIFISGCTVLGIRNSEESRYQVLHEENNIQIRLYEEMLIAQTTTYGDYKESSNSAFKKLAGYIFGDNQTQQDIAMTTPVIQKKQSEEIAMTVPVFQEQKQNNWVMSFVLPAKYTLDNVPLPNNKDVNLIQIPKKKIATIRYSGFINQEKMDAYKLTLQEWLESNQYTMASSAYSAAYDPPWTLPFLRRNEIHIEIE